VQKALRDGVALAYEERGTGSPPMVFVHGRASWSDAFGCSWMWRSHGSEVVGAVGATCRPRITICGSAIELIP
jgi:pimeloyl-ACP methyl ester carboxylesterase